MYSQCRAESEADGTAAAAHPTPECFHQVYLVVGLGAFRSVGASLKMVVPSLVQSLIVTPLGT